MKPIRGTKNGSKAWAGSPAHNLVLEQKGPNPDSSITVRLSCNKNTSVLDMLIGLI